MVHTEVSFQLFFIGDLTQFSPYWLLCLASLPSTYGVNLHSSRFYSIHFAPENCSTLDSQIIFFQTQSITNVIHNKPKQFPTGQGP